MATEASQPLKISLEASADLSASQYCFVKQDTNGRAAVAAAASDAVIGILQNKPKALGQMAEVVVVGVSKVVSSGTIAVAAAIGTDSTGKAQSVTPTGLGGSYVQGTKLAVGYLKQTSAAATSDVCTVVVNCLNPTPAT